MKSRLSWGIEMIAHCRRHLTASQFRRHAILFTALNAAERMSAIVQTILISRALGITDYGVYGLLFGTIGLVASVAGLQMGLAATVFISRYRIGEKNKAAAVISITRNFSLIVSAMFFLACVPFSDHLSAGLLGSVDYQIEIGLAIIFVGVSLFSGVQDGVAQGFEAFDLLAKIKIIMAVSALTLIYPIATKFGLAGVISVVLGSALLKCLVLSHHIRKLREVNQIPAVGGGVSFESITGSFALPSMLVSLMVGAATWLGMLVLSRQEAGFNSVAIANTGIQWRGPILLLASSVSAVAVPIFSRLSAANEPSQARDFRRRLVLVNFFGAGSVALLLVLLSKWILRLYGAEFAEGEVAFRLIVASTVPMVIANVYMSELVGAAKMWRQFLIHLPYVAVMLIGFIVMVPIHGETGYALTLLIGSLVFLATANFAGRPKEARPLTNSLN